MLVSERMSKNPVTILESAPIPDALKLMRDRKVRRLPVLNDQGRLAGIISEKDLLYASPSPATTLSIYEMQYLLSKISVKEVMTANVITVCEDCPIEVAARVMVDNKIGGVPSCATSNWWASSPRPTCSRPSWNSWADACTACA
jgi:acetoin utilization protein AcuB